MKARFSTPQLPVKIVQKDGIAYVYICLNETQGQETYPDMGNGQTVENYYEYDYNEIIAPEDELPLEDIRSHPENYINYAYQEKSKDPGIQTLEEIEKIKAAIERGLTT